MHPSLSNPRASSIWAWVYISSHTQTLPGRRRRGWRMAPARVANGLPDSRVWTVSCGPAHTLVVTEDGSVSAMGSASEGCLSVDVQYDRNVPTRIDPAFFGGARMVAVTAGLYCSTAVSEQGCLYWWGEDVLGLREPGRVTATCLPGGRVGRAKRLSRENTLTVAMGSHATLGAGHTMQGFAPEEIVQQIVRRCTVPHGGCDALLAGMRRLVVAEPAGGGVV